MVGLLTPFMYWHSLLYRRIWLVWWNCISILWLGERHRGSFEQAWKRHTIFWACTKQLAIWCRRLEYLGSSCPSWSKGDQNDRAGAESKEVWAPSAQLSIEFKSRRDFTHSRASYTATRMVGLVDFRQIFVLRNEKITTRPNLCKLFLWCPRQQ